MYYKRIRHPSRRYLGNKYKLLDFIESTIRKVASDTHTLLDVFAGTGVVAHHFMDKMQVITNDILYSNYLVHVAFMSTEDYNSGFVENLIKEYNKLSTTSLAENYMSESFGNTFFCYEDCKKIGYIRDDIQEKYTTGQLNRREMAILVTSLLYSMDRIANTCGHYDAYRRNAPYTKNFKMLPLNLSKKPRYDTILLNGDSNKLAIEGKLPYVDCVYCDPPYNSREYCDLYHVLENVACWKKPAVIGITRKMDRSSLKSQYCSKSASSALEELINALNCKYIILSYNNTGNRANATSNARISDEEIMRILSKQGAVQIFAQNHKMFSAGKSYNTTNEERLFVCKIK